MNIRTMMLLICSQDCVPYACYATRLLHDRWDSCQVQTVQGDVTGVGVGVGVNVVKAVEATHVSAVLCHNDYVRGAWSYTSYYDRYV